MTQIIAMYAIIQDIIEGFDGEIDPMEGDGVFTANVRNDTVDILLDELLELDGIADAYIDFRIDHRDCQITIAVDV